MIIWEKGKIYIGILIIILSIILLSTHWTYKPIIREQVLIGIRDGIIVKKSDMECFEIPNGITEIGYKAFYNCTELKSISMPDTVKTIDTLAFGYCKKLHTINLSNNLEKIGYRAFGNCESLIQMDLPDTLKVIESSAFADCTSLTSIVFPDNLEVIENGICCNCSSLLDIKMSNSIKSVGNKAFSETAFLNVTKPDEYGCIYLGKVLLHSIDTQEYVQVKDYTRVIANGAFIDNKVIKEIELPKGVIEIGDECFKNCNSLKKITILEGLETIGSNAFSRTGVKKIALPESIVYIGYEAFADCHSLREINLPNSIQYIGQNSLQNTVYVGDIVADDDGCIYVGHILLNYRDRGCEKIKVKNGTRVIAGGVFEGEKNIKEVYLPNSINEIGEKTFCFCLNLEKVDFEEGIGVEDIRILTFAGCEKLDSIDLPKSIKRIKWNAFTGCDFENIRIPENVEYLDASAMDGCLSLKTIELPESLKGKYHWRHIKGIKDPKLIFYSSF